MNLNDLKLPPQSVEAEQVLLGAIFERNSIIDDLDGYLSADDFYITDNKMIYGRMVAMAFANQPIDPVTLISSLEDAGTTVDDTLRDYIIDIVTSARGSANAKEYARIIRDKAQDRRLIAIGQDIQEVAYTEASPQEKLDQAQSLVMEVGDTAKGGAERADKLFLKSVDRIEFLEQNKGKITGVPTGFTDLDRLTMGLQPTDMIVIAGRPAMGKTTLAMNIAEYAGTVAKVPTLVFSLEMSSEQLIMRSISSLSRVKADDIKRGRIAETDNGWQNILASSGKVKDAPLYIDDRAALNSDQIISRTRRMEKKIGQKVGLIVIDYLQLLSDKGDGTQRITNISRNIKLAAKTLECPLIILSQLNRSVEQRQNKRPMPSDLRESGAIEQDADIIGFVYRDEVYNENSNRKGVAEFIIAKHRNGECSTVFLQSALEYCRFDNNVGYAPPIEVYNNEPKRFT